MANLIVIRTLRPCLDTAIFVLSLIFKKNQGEFYVWDDIFETPKKNTDSL